MSRLDASVGIALVPALLFGGSAPASAHFKPSDFPSTRAVHQAIGQGQWELSYLTKNSNRSKYVRGAQPAQCASDLPFRSASERRTASYIRQRTFYWRRGPS
jgi:hypothetical protein